MNGKRGKVAAHRQVITVAGEAHAVHGFLHGMRQPALSLPLRVRYRGDETAALERVDRELREVLGEDSGAAPFPGDGEERLLARLLYWAVEMQRRAGLGVFETGRILRTEQGDHRDYRDYRVLVPVMPLTQSSVGRLVGWLLRLFDHAWDGQSTRELRDELPGVWRILEKSLPGSHNIVPFMRSAHGLGIPLSHIAGTTYQFGYGARARWMNSTFTDRTPQISAVLARNKFLAARALARAGLPVPAHIVVGNHKEALAAAGKLGYPVVIKPGDRDRGEGVMAGLRDAAALQRAFDKAREVSSNILVERHVDGRDYRLTVLDGELIWAVERVPGAVTGDGEHSVRELVERLNADPRRGRAPHFLLKILDIDDEANELLAEQSLSVEDVPAAGRSVRLRRMGNIGRGGTPVAVMDRVHPDNRRLAERAAAALRLDIAGIDMLIPDIGRSWRENGGVICEINGQPNIGLVGSPHLYDLVLKHLVTGDGRIPIAVIVGGDSSAAADAVSGMFEEKGLCVGRFERGRVTVGGERIGVDWKHAFAAGEALIADAGVEAIVFRIDDAGVLRTGLPFDVFDMLIVGEDAADDVVEALRSACRGKVFAGGEPISFQDGVAFANER